MIKYSLKCKNCSIEFESWFSSSKEFDRLKKLKHLNCQNCNSIKIEKSLMAPSLFNTKKKTYEKNSDKIKDIKKNLKIIKNLLRKILSLSVIILHMKPDQFITIIRR